MGTSLNDGLLPSLRTRVGLPASSIPHIIYHAHHLSRTSLCCEERLRHLRVFSLGLRVPSKRFTTETSARWLAWAILDYYGFALIPKFPSPNHSRRSSPLDEVAPIYSAAGHGGADSQMCEGRKIYTPAMETNGSV
jgi:hypothetical protein